MKFYLAVTDNNWYRYLSKIDPEDVNFWQPGGRARFNVLRIGAPFLFKLKYPINAIAGIGFFASHTFLPLSIAWDAFQNRNGCESFDEFRQMILKYRRDRESSNPTIGCIVLSNPVFFESKDWLEPPPDWEKNIVQGKAYDTAELAGEALWLKIEKLLQKYLHTRTRKSELDQFGMEEPTSPEYWSFILTKIRLGQGAFRVLVTDAYQRKCSITGEKTLPVLEAAHIKPFADSGPQSVSNGILLRADIHKLFDAGYLTITKNHIIEVSSRIKTEFQNGREYYKYHGQDLLVLPSRDLDKPDAGFIDWHNGYVYKG